MSEYIEKQHLLSFLDDCIEEEKGNRSEIIVKAIKMVVERMPLGDVVERKKGKWVGRSENDCYPVCSECGCTRLGSSLGYCQKYVSFCEHCGADMRGGADNG